MSVMSIIVLIYVLYHLRTKLKKEGSETAHRAFVHSNIYHRNNILQIISSYVTAKEFEYIYSTAKETRKLVTCKMF